MILRHTILITAVLVAAPAALGAADGADDVEPALLAKFSEGRSNRTLFLYADREVKSVNVWLLGKWRKAGKVAYPHKGKQYHTYRVPVRFAPASGQKLLVSSWTPSGKRSFRHEIQVDAKDGGYAALVSFQRVVLKEEHLADKEQFQERQQARRRKRAADPFGFISLLNRYRAARGLGSVVHDPGLSQDAQVNNSMGSPHAFMGRARRQNWASGQANALEVLRSWQNSPGHNRNLLAPGMTRVGIAYRNGEWTMNGS